MRIQKRDGSLQELDTSKIQRAMLMAMQSSRERPEVMPLVHSVVRGLVGLEEPIPVARIGEMVESVLLGAGFTSIARAYIEHRVRRDAARTVREKPDALALPQYIHIAKYAAKMGARRELPHETVARVRRMHTSRFPELAAEISLVMEMVNDRRGMPSMRSMQFAGPAIVRDNARIYNCSFGHIDSWRRFQEMFYLLLCGCGVGYSVQWQHVDMLTEVVEVDTGDVCHYTIEDTIIGWADALGALLSSYSSGCYVEFNYSLIRAEGSELVTSGGRAPGHLPLKKCLEAVRGVLDGASGRKLRPLEAHDIMCHMATAVLAGGIRRASLIALFSDNDTEMMYCKAKGNFRPMGGGDPGLNAQREMANNSCALLRETCREETFRRLLEIATANYGCPGFYFTNNLDHGPNPCGEIGMWPVAGVCGCGFVAPDLIGECTTCGQDILRATGISFCNLTEVNCAAASDVSELYASIRGMAFLGTLQASYTEFPYLGPVTEAIVRRDALLGVGLTGIMDKPWVLDAEVLRGGALQAIAENKRVAALIGIAPAARVTTIKPSGTASLALGGVGSGIHPRWARRYFHRVTANKNEAAAAFFRERNPHMVEITPSGDWKLVFPVQCKDDAITVKGLSAAKMLDNVMLVYENWVYPGSLSEGLTHNVSCTITVRDSEWEELVARIWRERERIAAMSFAPYLLEQRFAYAPRQAIITESDEARWNHLIKLYKPVDWGLFVDEGVRNLATEPACAGGSCEL